MIDISVGNLKTNIIQKDPEGRAWRLVVSDDGKGTKMIDISEGNWKTNIVREDSEGRAWRLVVSDGEYAWIQIKPRSMTKYDAYIVFKRMESEDESGQSDRAQS